MARAQRTVHAVALAAWSLIAARLWSLFGPWTVNVTPFHSDCAIPVLMSDASRLTPFHLYYFGQSRFGGWPFLLAWALRRATGLLWTANRLYTGLFAAVMLGAWPVYALGGEWGGVLAASYLIAVGLDPGASRHVFDISQPYGWQIPSLLWAWWAMRRACEAQGRGGSWGRIAVVSLLALFATWMSVLSTGALALIALLEGARGWVLQPNARSFRRVVAKACIPVVAGTLGEALIRRIYAHAANAHGFWFQRTAVELDWHHLFENWHGAAGTVRLTPWWVVAPASTLACGLLVLQLWRVRRNDRVAASGRSLSRAMDAGILAIGAWGIGTQGFLAFVAFSWGRLNAYAPRYFAYPFVFWTLGLVTALVAGIEAVDVGARRRILSGAGAIALLGVVLVAHPPGTRSDDVARLERVSQELGRRAHGAVLFGDYWGTYIFAGMAPDAALVPVVAEGVFDRTPWTYPRLLDAKTVIVSHIGFSRFGSAAQPKPFISDRGALLRLVKPGWLVDGPYGFSVYENVTQRAASR